MFLYLRNLIGRDKTERRFRRQTVSRLLRARLVTPPGLKAENISIQGRIACHIVDADPAADLVGQLVFLAERQVRTFFIHTRRAKEAADLAQTALPADSAIRVLDWPEGRSELSLWRTIDKLNSVGTAEQWCLILRSGELLLYPFFEERTLPDLCQFLTNEHRRSFFALRLDVYHQDVAPKSLRYAEKGWRFDAYGYDFDFNSSIQSDLWRGGFARRFADPAEPNTAHISRVPLFSLRGATFVTKDLTFVLPRHLNVPCSPFHLSPTGCILSDREFRRWLDRPGSCSDPGLSHLSKPEGARACRDGATTPKAEPASRSRKLLSAPSLEVAWTSRQFVDAGVMNFGQWF